MCFEATVYRVHTYSWRDVLIENELLWLDHSTIQKRGLCCSEAVNKNTNEILNNYSYIFQLNVFLLTGIYQFKRKGKKMWFWMDIFH